MPRAVPANVSGTTFTLDGGASTDPEDRTLQFDWYVAPTTVGLQATVQEVNVEGKCGKVKVTGLGLPNDNRKYIKNGCMGNFFLWNEQDLDDSLPGRHIEPYQPEGSVSRPY